MIRALAAWVLLAAVIAGVPALLSATIGNPLGVWPALRAGDITDQVWIALLAVIVWVAWAQFTVSVAVEVAAVVRRAPVRRVPLVFPAQQQLARALVVAALLWGTAAGMVGAAPSAHARPLASLAVPPRLPTAPVAAIADAPATGSTGHSTAADHATPASPTWVYRVPADGSGPDTYWDMAEAWCGGGQHWPTLWQLNQGRQQPDGSVLTSPGLLRPGWTVLIPGPAPADAAAVSTTAHEVEVTVAAGDTLSGDAEKHGAADWQPSWQANKDRAEPGGARFTDPNLILPGWKLNIVVPGSAAAGTANTIPPSGHPAPTEQRPHPPPRADLPTQQPATRPPAPTHHPTYAPAARPPVTPPVAAQGGSVPPAAQPAQTAADHASELPMVAFKAGAGVLLAGVSVAALIRYRRRGFRWRHPGRTISAPEQVRVERTLLAAAETSMAYVEWLDEALRSLAQALSTAPGAQLPDVIAACLSAESLDLILTGPAAQAAPPPWTVSEDGLRWSVRREDRLPYDPARRGFHFAPFPTLASVGYTAAGEQWLLDLERIAALSLAGDADRCLNLARFLAAELAHNPWSEMLQVTVVGFGREMTEINPDRLTYTDEFDRVIAALNGQLEAVTETLNAAEVDVLTGRLQDIAGDVWAPHVVLIAPHMTRDTAGMQRLLAAMKAQPTRTTVALVLAENPDYADAAHWRLTIDSAGVLRIPTLGLELTAQQIPAEEAADLAAELAMAATTDDRPVPNARGDRPWDRYADAAGGLRPEVTAAAAAETTVTPSGQAQPPGPGGPAAVPALHLAESAPWTTNSVLPLSAQTYLAQTATTEEDLAALAPTVTDTTRRHVEDADPNLDADLADWYDPACTRPKVTLLGPVRVTAQGNLPPRNQRLQWNTEIVAYLATRSRGVTAERFGADMWPADPIIDGKTKVRQSVTWARQWLGVNPRTGRDYLPRGVRGSVDGTYRLEDELVDAELFRRIRLRGVARGADGLADLRKALDLVTGVPFDPSSRRSNGYGWLAQTPLDHEYAGMIVDVAHLVATHHLAAGEPDQAVSAAQVALRAGSSEDVPLLDLVAACDAQDNRAEADAYVKRILANNDAEVEEDLPPRTAAVLFRRQWIGSAS